ncbi:MAG: valine--tRNA ligase [Desulfobacterales bacterium C00003106]|nr:MAG: valine--tRNA ligase [Desulfobacterales bacterium C00003106]
MTSDLLNKGYEPKEVESRWYSFWQKEHLFAAEEKSNSPSYSIVIPPPNVTGVLHMGHAHNNTLQDILCRYKRMQGYNVLWMPGTDHAGIATQNVVEKQLAADGIDRHELGRARFLERVWEWRKEYGSAIINQQKRLGASCDWERERFTMDEGLSKAVRKVFVQLYNEGLIYRGNYIINWCPRCRTALADLEVEHEDHDGHLYHISYPFENGGGSAVVATTRPETMLGDTAIAVNPNDERYRDLKGAKVILPLMDRTIPVVFDKYVEMDFGTGALKITPAHDINDFEIGRRHDLEMIKVIDDDGKMNENAGKFAGMDRFECREAVIKALKAERRLVKIEGYQHSVGHCYRCRTTVEPNLSMQWFVRVKPLAEQAIDAVKSGRTRIIPETWNKTYFDWMENIRDWCISRQIWWGHQIPVWTCESCNEIIVSTENPESCPKCKGKDLVQDTDVLDTWFSSALWPFSTMGWPDKSPLLNSFYPTSVLITGFDILFFWVARMMMMGLKFMGEVPFRDVYIHALVRDAEGKKMSKSKGNVIDPLYVIDQYGTDAFRFTLAAFAAQGRDIRLSEERIEGYRRFINKLWNASRFSLTHLKEPSGMPLSADCSDYSLPDRWILSRLNRVTEKVTAALDDYRFNEAAGAIYQFVWHEFCDWYLECIKPILYLRDDTTHKDATRHVLSVVLSSILRLLHPFIPFVTEEIWHKLPGSSGSIMKADFPKVVHDHSDAEAERVMELIMGLINGVRNIRGEVNIPPSRFLKIIVESPDKATLDTIEKHRDIAINLARLEEMTIRAPGTRPDSAAAAVIGSLTLYVPLKGIIDLEEEERRLSKEIAKIEKELSKTVKKLSNESFLKKAPQDVVEKAESKKKTMADKRDKLKKHLEKIEALKNS